MVVCLELAQAAEDAEEGGFEAVLEWLDEGNDVNDVDDDGKPLIILATNHGQIGPYNVALARELVARGADVNIRSFSGMSAFETAILCSHPTALEPGPERDYLLLLIDAGLTLKEPDQHDPLAWTFRKFAQAPSRPALQFLTALLRAGSSLDAVTSDRPAAGLLLVVPGDRSAETLLRRLEQEQGDPTLFHNEHWVACRALVDAIRAAGGTWAAYRRQARKDVLRLRSLVSRGRARVRRTRTADPIPDRVFRLPNELAWHVLKFWRATDAAGEVL